MAEVVIAGAWKDKIVYIDRILSKTQKGYQKQLERGLEAIEKSHGEFSCCYVDRLYETYEKLKQIDRALEGRFNIIIVAELRHEDAWVL